MILTHRLKLGLVGLLCGLTLPAQALCHLCTMVVAKESDLRFGSMIVISPGMLTLAPETGLRAGTASVVTPTSFNSSTGPAAFRVTCVGAGNLSYQVAVVSSPISLNTSASAMPIGNFLTSPAASIERQVNNCLTYSEIVYVGATLTLGAYQSPGSYSQVSDITLEVRITANQ